MLLTTSTLKIATFTGIMLLLPSHFHVSNSNLQVIINGPARVDTSSLRIIKPDIKYRLNVILSRRSIYARVIIKMADKFCTDQAGNWFARTNSSIFTVHLGKNIPKLLLSLSVLLLFPL